jgi:hypothetical protein
VPTVKVRLSTLAALCALTCTLVAVPSASAFIDVGPTTTPAFTSSYAGGDLTQLRTLYPDAIDTIGDALTKTSLDVPSPWRSTYTNLLQDAEVIPKYRWTPGLGTIALGAAAFGAGWIIGSTVNRKYLHVQGVGLGSTASYSGALMSHPGAAFSWVYQSGGTPDAGWYLTFHDTASGNHIGAWLTCNNVGNCDGLGVDGNPELAQIFKSGLNGDAGLARFAGVGPNGDEFWERWIPEASMPAALVVDAPLQPYVSQPVTIGTQWANPANGDGVTHLAQPNGTGLTNPTPCYTLAGASSCGTGDPGVTPNVLTWPHGFPNGDDGTDPDVNNLNCQLDARYVCPSVDPSDPTRWDNTRLGGLATSWQLPSCEGLTVAACTTQIEQAADGANATRPTITELQLDNEGAVLTRPAGAVVSTSPNGGATIAPASPGSVQLRTNPDPLPIVVPGIQPWETGDAYCERLAGLGFNCTAAPLPSTSPQADPSHGPNEALRTSPAPQTRRSPFPPPVVTVTSNPSDWPYPDGDPNNPTETDPQPTPTPTGTGTSSCTCPPLDLGPLTDQGLGSKFPFGIFVYAATVVGDFNVEPQAPDFNINADVSAHGHALLAPFDVNLGGPHMAWLDTYMGWWRLLLSLAMWVGAVWFVGSRLLGVTTGDPGGAVDEVL